MTTLFIKCSNTFDRHGQAESTLYISNYLSTAEFSNLLVFMHRFV